MADVKGIGGLIIFFCNFLKFLQKNLQSDYEFHTIDGSNCSLVVKVMLIMMDNKYGNKIVITMKDMMSQMDISDKTLHRMIDDGDLPGFTYGSRTSRKKGWHAAVLERHAMERYERSSSYKNVSNARKIVTQDMSIVPLGRRNRTVAHQDAHLDNRYSPKKKLSGKKVPKSMRPSTRKSRVSAGFTYSNT